MAELESQPLSDEERAELEELRAEKVRREEQEKARREREELAALRAERAKADEAAAKAASEPAPAAPKPQPKKAADTMSAAYQIQGWRRRESNPRPLPCDGSALPTELRPQDKLIFYLRLANCQRPMTSLFGTGLF